MGRRKSQSIINPLNLKEDDRLVIEILFQIWLFVIVKEDQHFDWMMIQMKMKERRSQQNNCILQKETKMWEKEEVNSRTKFISIRLWELKRGREKITLLVFSIIADVKEGGTEGKCNDWREEGKY